MSDPRWQVIPKDPEHVSALIPGARATQSFVVLGRYAPGTEVRAWRGDKPWEAADPHACMQVTVNDVRLLHGEERARTVRLPSSAGAAPAVPDVDADASEDTELRVRLIANDDCGWLQDDRVRAIPILFALEGEGEDDARQIAPQYVLTNRSTLPEDASLYVRAGGAMRTLRWPITRESKHPQRFEIRLEHERSVPAMPDCLEIALVDEDADLATYDAEARRLKRREVITEIGGARAEVPLKIYAYAHPGCKSGQYTIPVRVKNLSTDREGVRDEIRALELTVRPAKFWVRWRWLVWMGIALAGLFAIVFGVLNIRDKFAR